MRLRENGTDADAAPAIDPIDTVSDPSTSVGDQKPSAAACVPGSEIGEEPHDNGVRAGAATFSDGALSVSATDD